MLCFDTETTGIGVDARITCAATCDSDGNARVWHSGGGNVMSVEVGNRLAEYLIAAPSVVTFNGAAFDLRLLYNLTQNADLQQLALRHVDIMYDWVCQQRYYASLQSFAEPTLGEGKSNTGAWAVEAWFSDDYASVLDYCKQDVEILRQLMHNVATNKQLKRKSKSGKVWTWCIDHVRTVSEAKANTAPAPPWLKIPPALPDLSWIN